MAQLPAARAIAAALVLSAFLAAPPAAAQLAPRVLSVYPVAAGGTAAAGDASDVASLLDAALHRVVQRTQEVVLAAPPVTRAACGAANGAAPACLAGLSGGGLVLRVVVHRSRSLLVTQLEAVDAKGKTFGPVSVSVDSFAQSAEPLVHGVLILVDQVVAASRKPDLRAAVPLPPPPVLAPKPALPPAIVAKPAPEPSPPRSWMRTAGPWLTGTGAALLAGGITLSVMNRSLANELDRKYAAGTLTPSDLDSYRRVEQWDRATQILLATGGALTLGGVAIWTAAPDRGARVAVAVAF